MKNQIKFKGFLASFRIKIKKMMDFTDAEYRLWDLLIHIADWDKDHKETFGTTGESLRDIQKHYLPWSVGKLSNTVISLVKRGLVERRSDSRIEIKNFQYLVSRSVHDIEQFYGINSEPTVHSDEQDVHPPKQEVYPIEQSVRSFEQRGKNQIGGAEVKKPINSDEYSSSVHSREQADSPKQTLDNPTQQQTGDAEMLLIEKLKSEYGDDIEIPLKKFGLPLIRDSARRMGVRIRKGENVKNKVGYITNLCKEGVRWEESEEKAWEDKIRAREVEERKKQEEMTRPRTPEEQIRINAALAKIRSELGDKLGLKKPNYNGASQPQSESPPAKHPLP